jgi:hypothetical protein
MKLGALRQNMPVAISVLVAPVQPQRVNQAQVLPGARHRHIHEAAFFLGLLAAADGHV